MQKVHFFTVLNLLMAFSIFCAEDQQSFIQEAKIPYKPFYFIRHGMTEWNVLTKQQGQTDIPLNELGRKQVKKLMVLTDELPLTYFCSSTLSRAYETMKILNESRQLTEFSYEDLKEQGKGILEGITADEWRQLTREEIDAAIEDNTLFQKRTENVLREILSYPGTTCIIAHSNNLRCIGKLIGFEIQNIPHDTIWYFEPPLVGENAWKMTELKLP